MYNRIEQHDRQSQEIVMTTTDLTAIRAAILDDPTDRVNWLVYADALEDAGDRRGELVRLMARPFETLSRDDRRRINHLRGTVSLLSEFGQVCVKASAVSWSTGHRQPGDVSYITNTLRDECHPLLITWGNGLKIESRIIIVQNKGGGDRWTWASNHGQSGGGAYPNEAEAILAAFSTLSAECLARIGWIDFR